MTVAIETVTAVAVVAVFYFTREHLSHLHMPKQTRECIPSTLPDNRSEIERPHQHQPSQHQSNFRILCPKTPLTNSSSHFQSPNRWASKQQFAIQAVVSTPGKQALSQHTFLYTLFTICYITDEGYFGESNRLAMVDIKRSKLASYRIEQSSPANQSWRSPTASTTAGCPPTIHYLPNTASTTPLDRYSSTLAVGATVGGAQQELTDLEQLQSELIAVLGYQFWTPLTNIQACLEALERQADWSRRAEQSLLVGAIRAVDHLCGVVSTCLDLLSTVATNLRETQATRAIDRPTYHDTGAALAKLHSMLPRHLSNAPPRHINDPTSVVQWETRLDRLRHTWNQSIAIVGHELRTPLCSLQVCLETFVCELSLAHHQQQTLLATARTDLERLRQLIQNFLTLARLERGDIALRSDLVSIPSVLELVLMGVATRYPQELLPSITVEMPPTIPIVRGDEDQLAIALTHLLDNACQFTDSGGSVHIAAQVQPSMTPDTTETSQPTVEVTVSDTGKGMDPSHLDRIFDYFYQEEAFLNRTINGAGIGLSICRKIIHTMDGRIWATSSGQTLGSCFHVALPALVL